MVIATKEVSENAYRQLVGERPILKKGDYVIHNYDFLGRGNPSIRFQWVQSSGKKVTRFKFVTLLNDDTLRPERSTGTQYRTDRITNIWVVSPDEFKFVYNRFHDQYPEFNRKHPDGDYHSFFSKQLEDVLEEYHERKQD